MDVYSLFRRSLSKLKNTSFTTSAAAANKTSKNKLQEEEEEEKLYGLTDQLIEFIKSLSLDTFKNFSLPDEEESSCDGVNSGNVRTDLSEWQEAHAMLVLSRVKELAQLRFQLCPRYLKERQFWRKYFTLVRSYVAEYELHAIRMAKLKQLTTGSEAISNCRAYEVEMSEAKSISSETKSISSETCMQQKPSNSLT